MARRSVRHGFNPEAALRAHFAAEIDAERQAAARRGSRLREAPATDPRRVAPAAERRGGPGRGGAGRRVAESAYAAALALAVGLSLAGGSGIGGLGDAIAETTLRGGGAAAVGSVFGSGFSAAILGFGALKGADSAVSAQRAFGRFK